MSEKLNVEELQLESWIEERDWIYNYYDAAIEDEFRVELLRDTADSIYLEPYVMYTNEYMHDLADELDNCTDDDPCKSAACKRCVRWFQIESYRAILQAMVRELETEPDTRFCAMHLVQYSRAVDAYGFVDYDIKADKNRLGKLLSSSKVAGPVLGAFEMDFHKTPQKWLSHYHLFARLSGNEQAMASLAGKVGKLHPEHIKTNVRARPFLVQEIQDPRKQISYLYKLGFNEVRDYKTPAQKRRTKKYRLEERLFCNYLCWMHEMGRKKFLVRRKASDWLRCSKF
ncbi:hypothetical protein ACN9RQ_002728 [Vibrio parahaemolyticus]|uniref:hypothetical protein n=1 Tax=Vibrio owensii TaxID=696485 RepID=UPI0018699E87|nr:hypothetical protein [Vibrio owensii]ELA8151182.1 hypothetical protein [Vibrio parahaemolyticus]ELY3378519.1 hypothetical protein [Vibrio parahaemolyticus]MBE4285420.1 hypothetical protein [Vibrio parahaemolyticus]MBM5045160.1 hypothetical protein [Vibrio parahaemolyticus]MDA0382167.1 hypothetical protein [Vibrio owensii]